MGSRDGKGCAGGRATVRKQTSGDERRACSAIIRQVWRVVEPSSSSF